MVLTTHLAYAASTWRNTDRMVVGDIYRNLSSVGEGLGVMLPDFTNERECGQIENKGFEMPNGDVSIC